MDDTRRRTIGREGSGAGRGTGWRRVYGAVRVAALGLALVLGLAGGATATPPGPLPLDGPGPALGGGPIQGLSECAQRCFANYMQNVGQCASQFCSQILFFTFCDNDDMTQCKINAQTVFDICIQDCNPLI